MFANRTLAITLARSSRPNTSGTYSKMIPTELYRHPRYLELADQVENHWTVIDRLLRELGETFPLEDSQYWAVMADGRPRLVRMVSDEVSDRAPT